MRISQHQHGNRVGVIDDLRLEARDRSGASDELVTVGAVGSPGLLARRRRDDSGLTTLEWLLIVAAVAGLAALAVVLVTNVVGDTSEQISGQSARLTAARVAADELTTKARGEDPIADDDDDAADARNSKYKSDCNELKIIYGDVSGAEFIWSLDITVAVGNSPMKPTLQTGAVTEDAWLAAVAALGCWVYTS